MAIGTSSNNSIVKWGSIFIIVLMLLSGVAVFFGSKSSNQNKSPTPTDQTPTNAEQFSGEDVQGTIVEVFNAAIVGGQTSDGDKTEIDVQLKTIPGVESLTSQFSPLNKDGSVTYIANISISSDTDHTAFADAVSQLNLFDSPEVYFQASIQIQTEQEVKNSKQQLTRITLPNAQIQAIVSPLTQKGDVITGVLAASFQGTQLVSAYLLETQNVTASPTPISLTKEYSIKSLQPVLSVVGTVDYFPGLSSQLFSADIQEISNVESVSIPFFPSVNNQLVVEYADANTMTGDLNTFVSTHPESFDQFFISQNGFVVGLKNVNVNEAKDLLSSKINELTSTHDAQITFTPPRTQFLIDANTSAVSNASVAAAIQNYFASFDSNASIEIYQNGLVSAAELAPIDSNVTYPLESGEIPVVVFPGHKEGDLVTIMVNAIALRGKIEYVNGVESLQEQ